MAKTKRAFEEYKCKICKKVFSESGGLAHHIQLHTTDKPFSCHACSFTCKTKKYLHRHVSRVHSKREMHNECDVCSKKFLYKSALDKHMYTHTNERPFKCEVCNKGFNSRYSLSTHRHTHTGAKPYKCSYCDYACRDNSTLRKHRERHTGVTRLYQCTACDKSYKTKRILKLHVAEVHMQMEMKTKPCPQCGKLFKSLKSLNTHVRMSHLKLYTCKCDICGATLSSKYNMRAHLTTHIDYRPFKCSFEGCDKRYKDKGGLKKHTIVHYPEKHFECSICKKKFSRLHRMYEHKKQHKAKKKSVFCDHCGKGFYNKNYVRSHITRKHMHRQHYICDLCDFITYNKPSIVMHIKHGHVSEMDRKCKICKKTYKKHIYLKLHYWNTHSIKYKLNRHTLRKPKKKKNNIIIEDDSEPDVKDIELMHEIKVEAMSDTEEIQDDTVYSKGVLSEDINRAMTENEMITADKNFKDFFIEQIVMPSSSNDEETQQKETDIYVDVTCQKEAERVRTEMLERWRQNGGVRPFVRLKRHHSATFKDNRLKRVKSEKIEVTIFSENESNIPTSEEVSRKIEADKKKSRKTNDCDKINEILDKFNNSFSEIINEDGKICKINHKISKIGELIQNDLDKNSPHCKKQIIKKLNRALNKYNILVKKMYDIQNKEPLSSPENVTSSAIENRYNDIASIGDENVQNSENNTEITLENDEHRNSCEINKDDYLATIGDKHGQNNKYTENVTSSAIENRNNDIASIGDENVQSSENNTEKTLENDEHRNSCVINKDDDLATIGDKHGQNNKYSGEITLAIGDISLGAIGYEHRQNDEDLGEITSSVDHQIGDDCSSMELNDEVTSSKKIETRNIVIETDNADLPDVGDDNRQNSAHEGKDDMIPLDTDEQSVNMTKTGDDQASTKGDDYMQVFDEMTSLENCDNRGGDVIENGSALASIDDENRPNSVNCTSLHNEIGKHDGKTSMGLEIIKNIDDHQRLNDEITFENHAIRFGYDIEESEEQASISNVITSSAVNNRNVEVTKTAYDHAPIVDVNIKNYSKGLNNEVTSSENDKNRYVDVIKKTDDQASFHDKWHKISSCENRSGNLLEICDEQASLGEENILNDLKDEITVLENEDRRNVELCNTRDEQSLNSESLGDENSTNDASTENYKTITNDCLFEEQVNAESSIDEVNQLNYSNNGLLYENSLAELVKLRKRKCVNNDKNISNTDATEANDFVYISNLKEIDSIIKEIDNMVALIGNDQSNLSNENNLERLKLLNSTRKRKAKRGKRNIKKKTDSENNKICKVKKETMIRDDFVETNNGTATTELNDMASTENDETLVNNQSELQENSEITIENHLEERDVHKYWTRRSVKSLYKNVNDLESHNDFDSDDDRDKDFVPDDDDDDESGDEEKNKSNKFKINSHQCYVCFKLYETKEKLLNHCKEHFDICNLKMLKKCPFCEYVTNLDLVRHVRLKHKINLNYLYGTLKDRKNNNNKSRFYFNVENNLVDEIEVIPSIKNLNRQAFLKIDRKRREKNDKEVKKTKLVKKDGEWVVEKVLINTEKENYVLPNKVEEMLKEKESKNGENDKNGDNNNENQTEYDRDDDENNGEKEPESDIAIKDRESEAKNEDYCVKMQRLYRIAKKNGQKMLFPCDKCEKICQTLSALKLHLRRHDPNAKPFKKKVWKHKLSEEELKKLQENKEKSKTITNKNNKNRYEKPKPIVNKHKCDPKLKDFYEKNIKGGDIEFWQFLKIFNKMSRENVNDFSDLENRKEFGIHFIDPELNPPNSCSTSSEFNLEKSGSLKTNLIQKQKKVGSAKTNFKALVHKKGLNNKITKGNKFKRTVLISRKEFLRRKAIKDNLRQKNIGRSNTNT